MSARERLHARATMLRQLADQIDVEAEMVTMEYRTTSLGETLGENRAHGTKTGWGPLSLESATEHVPLCDRGTPHPLSSCLGCHPEGE